MTQPTSIPDRKRALVAVTGLLVVACGRQQAPQVRADDRVHDHLTITTTSSSVFDPPGAGHHTGSKVFELAVDVLGRDQGKVQKVRARIVRYQELLDGKEIGNLSGTFEVTKRGVDKIDGAASDEEQKFFKEWRQLIFAETKLDITTRKLEVGQQLHPTHEEAVALGVAAATDGTLVLTVQQVEHTLVLAESYEFRMDSDPDSPVGHATGTVRFASHQLIERVGDAQLVKEGTVVGTIHSESRLSERTTTD